ncbi:MAG: hypothetical protein KKD01_06205 [Proteobacteria bacterium]|nr:hypothetical protein [Pseudomonadota bacterium]
MKESNNILIKKIIFSYGIALLFVGFIHLIFKNYLATLSFLVAAIFAPLRMIFPGYSKRHSHNETKVSDEQ